LCGLGGSRCCWCRGGLRRAVHRVCSRLYSLELKGTANKGK
jgi:hypothetical protein